MNVCAYVAAIPPVKVFRSSYAQWKEETRLALSDLLCPMERSEQRVLLFTPSHLYTSVFQFEFRFRKFLVFWVEFLQMYFLITPHYQQHVFRKIVIF